MGKTSEISIIINNTKRCSKCLKYKDLNEFYSSQKDKTGYQSQCKDCKNPNRLNSRSRFVAENNKLKTTNQKRCTQCELIKSLKEFNNTHNNNCKLCVHNNYIKKKYNDLISPLRRKLEPSFKIDLPKMIANQNNRCAICDLYFKNSKATHIDHCHQTMKVRGILCKYCNHAIGFFKDNINTIYNAIKYLEKIPLVFETSKTSLTNARRYAKINQKLRISNYKICNLCEISKLFSEYTKVTNGDYSSKCKPCNALNHKKLRYGLDNINFNLLLEIQNNLCAICEVSFKNTKIEVDHCHQTKVVRGLLCHSCNSGLGQVNDNINILQSAIHYSRWFRVIS